MLLIGLVCGAVLTTLYLGYRDNEPGGFGSGIRSLLEKEERPPREAAVTDPATSPEPAPRVKLDYHEVLPNIDAVLSESELMDDEPPVEERPSYQYILQAGSFRSAADAESMKATLALAGFESIVQRVEVGSRGTYYRVRLGPYQSKRRLQLHRKQLARHGVNALAIRLDESG